MIQKITFLIFVFTSSLVFSQTEVFSFMQDDETDYLRKKDGYSFSNNINGNIAIVFVDRKNVFANLFDSAFTKLGNVSGEALKNKYSDLLGYRINNKKYEILAANSSKKKFAVQVLDFNTGNTSVTELDIDLGKERFLETIHFNNDLFVITATKKNQFVLRKLADDFSFQEVKRFDIQAEDRDEKLLTSGFFTLGFFGSATSNITKVDNRVPNALEQTAQDNKLYQEDNKIYLTIESEDELLTTLHTIDLESFSLSTKTYPYPEGKLDEFKAYNSFILDNKLLQMGSSRKEMILVIKDFDNTVVKEFYLEKDEPIAIKNSPIIQEGITSLPFQNRREMEETSKFLRKVSSGNLGVTAYKNGENYAFTIGGYKNVSTGGGMMMGGGGFGAVPIATTGGAVFVSTYNPTYMSYNSYSSTKSTYFNTTLDSDFNYLKKEEEEANIFEQIKEFKKDVKHETAEDVFFHQDVLYFGYYDTKEKKYHLYKM